jgi:hypothetical protein
MYSSFPIFAIKLSHCVTQENNVFAINWPSLKTKKTRKCPFFNEKSLVGLTPVVVLK